MESYVIARPTGQIENGKHAKYSDKKVFEEFFTVVDVHVSVYAEFKVQKSSRYLGCNKSYRSHPGTVAQNSNQIPVGAQGFVGSPPHPGCILIYSNH